MPTKRPAKPPSAEAAAADLLTACGQLIRRLRAESNNLELTWSQIAALSRLEGGAMSTAELARAEAVKPQSMGATLGVLEEEGLVERTPHPSDGRQFLVRLTREGIEARQRTRNAKQAWLTSAVARLTSDEQADLIAAAAVMRRLADMSQRDAS
ncbi:MAG: MarR family transcriptional regulator [Luteibacter sp.]|uniref:MarR family winged helix-turn-helix transcriptional regulator n=1 Tax=Luteibacter sp. TaxID=1886636 RepID=UPI0028071EA0|nr:MarR family transcriptional regulator [Luteibacter sp.]MDQ7994484.1 MarR family transcriptional regulator [Luteibacter sp.]MDQ8050627.1 MarR family transcriptional regulator [Luteibacter sp.]